MATTNSEPGEALLGVFHGHTFCVIESTVNPVLSGHSKKTKHWLSIPIIAKCRSKVLQESILQYFLLSLSYHLSFRPLFCLFLIGRLRLVLLYRINSVYDSSKNIEVNKFYYTLCTNKQLPRRDWKCLNVFVCLLCFLFLFLDFLSDIQYSFSTCIDHSILFHLKYRDHSIQNAEIMPFKMQRSFHLKHLCLNHHHFQTCLESPEL